MKSNNEITVKIKGEMSEFKKILENKNYEITSHFILDDVYMIPTSIDIRNLSIREVIAKSILIRKVDDIFNNEIRQDIVNKIKIINEKGEIEKQMATRVRIKDCDEAIEFFKSLGYKELMNIIEEDFVYSNENISIATKDVKDGDKMIEVETKENSKYDTIENIKEYLIKEDLPLDFTDLFIKKAEVELGKILNS